MNASHRWAHAAWLTLVGATSCALEHHVVRIDASSDGDAHVDARDIPISDSCVPVREICDGRDNDCDGVADNGNPGGGEACDTGRMGVCAAGRVQCLGGLETCVGDREASAETCNGVDDDCNGTVDDSDPGSGAACVTTMPGACAGGHQHCVDGQIVCRPDVAPVSEQCDGVDNDCNGAVDNGFACALGSGSSACATTCGSQGTRTCTSSCAFGPCIVPAEACDFIDQDCDGRCDPPACRRLIYSLLWQFMDGADRAFSTSPTELAALGYVNEGPAFYLYTVPVPGGITVNRCLHTGVTRHFVGFNGCSGVAGAVVETTLGYAASTAACSGISLAQYYCGANGFVATIDATVANNLAAGGCSGGATGGYAWGGP